MAHALMRAASTLVSTLALFAPLLQAQFAPATHYVPRNSQTTDETGATIAFTGGTGAETIDVRLDCQYDTHGNWTACRQLPQAKTWRRTIKYRN